jgi:pilus assembly protein CpaE
MKTSILYWSAELGDSLRQRAAAEGHEVLLTLLRDDAIPLDTILDQVQGDMLILECQSGQQLQDIATLERSAPLQTGLRVMLLVASRSEDVLLAALQAGVREVLPSPPDAAAFSQALQRLAKLKKSSGTEPAKRAKTVAFVSCKGGSGATFLATNFAQLFAQEYKRNTLFLDLDMQCGDAAYYVSPGPSKSNITEITRQIERLDHKLLASSVLHVAPNFDLLSAPEEPEASYAMSPTQLERLVDVAAGHYDMVVMDLERVVTPLTAQALDMADVVYLVMESLLPFLRDAKRLVGKFREMGYDDKKIRLIVNRYERSDVIDLAQIERAVGLKVSHTIPSIFQDVAQAINTGTPLVQVNPRSPILDVLKEMARELEPEKPRKPTSWLTRVLGL